MNENLIRDLVSQAKDHDSYLLTAGLAVLSKEVNEYLVENPREDATMFNEVFSAMLVEEKRRFEDSPFFAPLKETGLPTGIAEAAASGAPDLRPLSDPSIVHEWTFGPGEQLLRKFGEKLKDTICGKDGPYRKFKKGLLGQADLPATIVSTILAAGFSAATFWYPLAVYVGLLLIKVGLKTYCE